MIQDNWMTRNKRQETETQIILPRLLPLHMEHNHPSFDWSTLSIFSNVQIFTVIHLGFWHSEKMWISSMIVLKLETTPVEWWSTLIFPLCNWHFDDKLFWGEAATTQPALEKSIDGRSLVGCSHVKGLRVPDDLRRLPLSFTFFFGKWQPSRPLLEAPRGLKKALSWAHYSGFCTEWDATEGT